MKEMGKEELLGCLRRWYSDSVAILRELHLKNEEKFQKEEHVYAQLVKLIEDSDQNLTDCTEAIDALIEERDALIEDTQAYDERIDAILEHYERQNREGIEIIGDECDVSWLHKNLHAEALGTSEHKRIIRVVRQNQRIDSESSEVDEGKDETIVEVWLEKNWNEDWCHSDDYEEMVKWLRKFKKQLLSQKQPSEDWLPTAEHINALPKGMKDYICGIETMSDPQWMIQQNILMKDTIRQLRDKILSQKRVVE